MMDEKQEKDGKVIRRRGWKRKEREWKKDVERMEEGRREDGRRKELWRL